MFFDNYDRLCRDRGSNPSAIASRIGLARSTPASWKANGTIPKQDILDKLAEELGCQVADFFVDNVDNSVNNINSKNYNNSSRNITTEEDELIQIYRSLSTRKEKLTFILGSYDLADSIKAKNE